ncbi:hypothetical protein HYT56_00770 [Candidatus Woesearchaeota archaeon]|nr:hypothetical protein [Candidatus Woesearchaeota archaeon]
MEGYTAVEVVEYILLITFALLLVFFGGLTEKQVNQLKADDLALSIDSIFLFDNDIIFVHELGKQFFVEEINDRIHIYQSSSENSGIKKIAVDSNYVLTNQLEGKDDDMTIKKEGKRVIIS